jgi:hypothetical protein
MSSQCTTTETAWQDRRCRRLHKNDQQRKKRPSFRSRTKKSPSLAFLASVLFVVGSGRGSVVVAAVADEGNVNAYADRLRVLTDDVLCIDFTTEFINQDEGLASALETFQGSQIQKMDEETGVEFIGYPLEAANAMEEACDLSKGHWAFAASMDFTCIVEEMETLPLHVDNFGSCFAMVDDCLFMDTTSLVRAVLHDLGWNCFGGDDEGDGDSDENNGEGEAEDENSDRLPFLTDDDVLCIDATTEFINQDKGLASAIETFQGSQILKKDEETDVELLGYPVDAAKVMKSACELNKGHWAFVRSMNFTCVIEGMETIPLHVHDFGSCLAKIDDCVDMDTTSLLRADLADLGFACWEDDEEGDGDSDSAVGTSGDGDSGASTESGEGSESGENAEENGYASETDPENDSSEGKNNDQDSDKDTDQDPSDEIDEEMSNILADMGLSESDEKCMDDSMEFGMDHPELEQALNEYTISMVMENSDVTRLSIGFPDDAVDKLRSVCTDSTIGGYFTVIGEIEFVCGMMSVEVDLKMTNFAICMADTDECFNMDSLLLMEDVWKSMGLTCTEQSEADGEDATSSTTDTTEPDGNESDEDDSLAKALGLTESEVACMSGLTNFIDSSDVLSNATAVYQKSVQMTDPTKLGYAAASASDMEQVCEDQGGIWSFIESEDVTCTINGWDRCINVYNFGNCIANNDDCQSMDPFVLVKGFFMEVLNFSCREKCDEHKDTTGHSPSSAPHKNSPWGANNNNNNNNLSSQQSNNSSSSSLDELPPSFATAAIILGVVVAVGLFGFFRYRASHGRERTVRSAYEMTDISDLGFESFT